MDCLSPDLVAAWMDGTLSREERAAAEAHASDCAHCQAMLAAMARTAPARPQRAWWKTPAVRWMVPLTATAAVVLTVVTVGRVPRRPVHDDAAVVERTMAGPPAAASPESRAAAPERATVEDATRESAKSVAQRREAVAPRADGRGAVAGAIGADAVDALASQKTTATAPGAPPPLPGSSTGVAALPAESAGPPVTPPPTAAATPQPAPVTTPLPLQETVTITGAAPAPESARKSVTARAAGARAVEVVSTDRAYRWRAIEPGSVIFSMDGGFTWRPSATGTSVALHAGSAPSRQVCWFVGQLGTVLVTTDGTHWQLRPFPERVDLTEVRATDARSAVVTTANRRRFATTDGGATWSPLQED